MAAAQEKAAEIERELRALAHPTADACRRVRRRYTRELRDAPARQVLAIGESLILERGQRFVGSELIHEHAEARAALRAAHLRRLAKGLDSWASVDIYGSLLSGPAWREKQVPDSLIHGWARSRDRWLRRTSLVSTVPLNVAARGGHGDARRTLAVCRLLIDDRDDMVEKALSWALRCLVEHDRAGVESFLTRHDARLAARVRREVRNKLRTGLKNPGRSA
jgi:3-methyladenine DNA glycosylase AlkD